jgi:non-heme chloroperoxidase
MTATIKTWDGVSLSYSQTGPTTGPNLLFIPGWGQTAEQWKKQVDHFNKHCRVTTYDHRGQGESESPLNGYRISRLASDLNDLITQLNLKQVTIIGHSMGCSVIWSYWDLFIESRHRISRLVLVDQAACLVPDPAWKPEELASFGAIFPPDTIYGVANAIKGEESQTVISGLLKSMFTSSVSQTDFDWVTKQSGKMRVEIGSTLLLNHAFSDWRDVLPRINVPTLVIGGKSSLFPYQAMEWIASQIKGSKCKIFEIEELGSHFMFWENPSLFNSTVEAFLN